MFILCNHYTVLIYFMRINGNNELFLSSFEAIYYNTFFTEEAHNEIGHAGQSSEAESVGGSRRSWKGYFTSFVDNVRTFNFQFRSPIYIQVYDTEQYFVPYTLAVTYPLCTHLICFVEIL